MALAMTMIEAAAKAGADAMTVRELIAELQKHDPDAEVLSEGCDCYGDVKSVADYSYQFPDRKVVMLNRNADCDPAQSQS